MNAPRETSDHYFDHAWKTKHPLVVDLERRIRRPILFSIDGQYRVERFIHRRPVFSCDAETSDWLGRDPKSGPVRGPAWLSNRERARRVIAEAIALHLETEKLAED